MLRVVLIGLRLQRVLADHIARIGEAGLAIGRKATDVVAMAMGDDHNVDLLGGISSRRQARRELAAMKKLRRVAGTA